jgi:hypothetical protein
VTPKKPGLYKVKPRVLKEDIKDCPFEIKTDGPILPNSKRSSVVNWGIKIFAPTKKETDFQITLDSKNNSQNLQIVKDELKNKFIVSLNPIQEEKKEIHNVFIKLNDNNIKGSPFKQTF